MDYLLYTLCSKKEIKNYKNIKNKKYCFSKKDNIGKGGFVYM